MSRIKPVKVPEIPTLDELVSERVVEASKHRGSGPRRKKNLRFPVVVDTATREWLDTQAQTFNTSLAGMAGMILIGVARREGKKA